MLDGSAPVFSVTDLKQYGYCPRIVFYTYCLPLIRPTTYKMAVATEAHEDEKGRERRRSLAGYGLAHGRRHFDVWLQSAELGLRGRVDLVIEVTQGEQRELLPVDYKQSRYEPGAHVRRQLTAYGMMLEENWQAPVRRGFIYNMVSGRAQEVAFTAELRQEVRHLVAEMREMVLLERMPGPVRQRQRCINCEFRRFCNDVV
jgi:CRISPR-associated exonuclease Cas4